MKSSDLVRQSARLAHQRNKIRAIKLQTRGAGSEVAESLRLAMVQLSFATAELDRAAGEQARHELKD